MLRRDLLKWFSAGAVFTSVGAKTATSQVPSIPSPPLCVFKQREMTKQQSDAIASLYPDEHFWTGGHRSGVCTAGVFAVKHAILSGAKVVWIVSKDGKATRDAYRIAFRKERQGNGGLLPILPADMFIQDSWEWSTGGRRYREPISVCTTTGCKLYFIASQSWMSRDPDKQHKQIDFAWFKDDINPKLWELIAKENSPRITMLRTGYPYAKVGEFLQANPQIKNTYFPTPCMHGHEDKCENEECRFTLEFYNRHKQEMQAFL